jgi:hypothetical protein
MAEPTLTQVFGAAATQTATTLTIAKADLPGLTAAADNKAEQILGSLVLKLKTALTTANQEANPEQNITVEIPGFGAETLVDRNNQRYRQYSHTINIQELDTSTGLNPNNL